MGSPRKRIRNGIEYLSLRTARKQWRCEANHSDCIRVIRPGAEYVLAELPPSSEMGNDRWWRIPVCRPCGEVGRVAEQLLGYAVPVTEWLIWSNHHKSWWGPNGSGYRAHIADAGRYALADTEQWLGRGCYCCRVPEALVPAPSAQVLADPVPLAAYAAQAPKRFTRETVAVGRINQHATWGA